MIPQGAFGVSHPSISETSRDSLPILI